MNTKRLFITLLLSGIFLTSAAQISFSEKMGKQKNLVAATISKSMLKMMSDKTEEGLDMGAILDKLTSLQIISTTKDDETTRNTVLASFKRVTTTYKFEKLLTINEGFDEESGVYFRDYGNNCRQFALLNEKQSTLRITILTGSLKLEDVQNLAKKKREAKRKNPSPKP